MSRIYLISLSLLFALSASLVLTGGATSNLPSGLENPLTIRYPQLAQAAAPDWLVEGTRATYYVISGTADSEQDTSVGGINQLLGFWIPEDAVGKLGTGTVDSDPDTGMVISIVQSGADGIIFEKTNQQDYRALFAYDSNGRLVQMTTELNPDSTYGSSRTETLQLIG